jgi:chemosensory pili system protein ChpA (sensor histidine kinase/response regulator)
VDSELLDKLVNAAGEVSIFRSRLEQQVGGLRSNLGEFDETLSRMREQFRKLDIEIETQIRSNYTPAVDEGNSGFDPLEMDEFSTLHQLTRSLSESVADLLNLQDMLADNARKSDQLLMQQSRVATELQEGLMRTRMVPFGSIAPRLRRIVRSAASETGKKARLQLQVIGSSDALDRNVLEHITAPLEHMMRNAVVHGVELPKARKAAGKPAEGAISLAVESEATEFVIRINDDGAGINLDAIRQRAIERGVLDADANPRPEQLYEFILDSGFSTSDSVTNLAGRGVGMDVVSSEIKQIGGSLEIDSKAGQGTRFTIRIPFTLAVMQAIGVIAGKQRYLLPLSSVVGVSRMQPDEYAALVAGDNPQFKFAGESYPVLDLEGVLGEPAHPLERDNVSLLILNHGEQRAAFRVVELLPHREIVIKPVGPQVSCVPGILGGSISANGEVLVILDPGPLIRHARLRGVRVAPVVQPLVEAKEHPLAMVVDDSITMRKVTSRVLESHGMEVITARDGVEALELMQDRAPDILLLDIEMPRMDGYELAEHVRDDVRLRHIPIIMITSRAGQKHRDRAAQVGANAYLSKPYAESELVDEVDRLLEEGID